MNYIFYIFLGILLYFYFNLKEKLLIPFDITQMNRCKAYVCPSTGRPRLSTLTPNYQAEFDSRGDCYFQCMYTSLNMIDSINDSFDDFDIISTQITDYMAQHEPPILGKPFLPVLNLDTGYDLDEEFNLNLFLTEEEIRNTSKRELVTRILERYENPMNNRITSKEMAITNLIDLFSKLQPNSSRILIFIEYINRKYYFHVVIIARSDSSIFILDPKHRIIMKNSDIWNNPWLNIDFYFEEQRFRDIDDGVESFNWNLESTYVSTSLYFLPVVNVESMLKSEYGGPDLSNPDSWSDVIRNDINPNFERDSIIISRLLREGDSELSLIENQAYGELIRRLPDGNITDPRAQRALWRCAANVRPRRPPRENESCDPVSDARNSVCPPNQNCYHTYNSGEDSWKCQSDESHIGDIITENQYCSIHNDKCAEGLVCRVNDIGIGTCQ